MNKHYFLLGATVLALLFSCTREPVAENVQSGQILTFSAGWAETNETRTELQSDGTSVWWTPGEVINVFYGNKYSGKFTSTNTENQALASFEGTLTVLTGTAESGNEASSYWAIYPYNASNTCDGNSVTLGVPTEQSSISGSFADKMFPAVATSTGLDLAFYNVCGGVRFSVSQGGIIRVCVKSKDGSPVSGNVRIGFGEDNKPNVLGVTEAVDSIVVNAPSGGFVPGSNYFAAMLPRIHNGGLEVTLYTATKKASKTINGPITVKRSIFGKLDYVDNGLSNWKAYVQETEGGGTRSGLYLGIVGFNDQLYKKPIDRLDVNSYGGFTSFIDGLSTQDATLLYYSVRECIGILSRATYPDNLYNVSLVTFTDGLDQGSPMMIDDYPGDEAYLQELHTTLLNTTVSGIPLTAYSIGLRGNDVTDVTMFRNNLKQLATSDSNAYEVTSMSSVNSKFQEIADQVSQTRTVYSYDLDLTITGQPNGRRMRFSLDNVSSATSSTRYIEGVFDLPSRSLVDVTYHGVTATSGDTIQGEVNSVYVTFRFKGLMIGDGKSDVLNKSEIMHWYLTSTNNWQPNSEFKPERDVSINTFTTKKSVVVLLNLDCSTSLGGQFSTLQAHAKTFVQRLYNASIDPLEVTGVSLDKSTLTLYEGGSASLQATVSPSTAENKSVIWRSSDPSVATVSTTGVVSAVKAGTCLIEAKTVDGGYVASCSVTVLELPPEAVDLGLSVMWASFNLGASRPEGNGDYYAWGETEPYYSSQDPLIWKNDKEEGYKWSSYKWCEGTNKTLTRYCQSEQTSYWGGSGAPDNKTEFRDYNYVDDAARMRLGDKWRTPTDAEWTELMNYCTWTWTSQNGVNGYRVTSNRTGYTNKFIFLPAAGDYSGVRLVNVGSRSFYWSSSLDADRPSMARMVNFYSTTVTGIAMTRDLGGSIRPIYEDSTFVPVNSVSLNKTEVNLYVGKEAVLKATVTPSNATDKSVTWSSSNTSVATVSSSGIVTGVAAGSAIITVTTKDGGKTANCSVSVSEFTPSSTPRDLTLAVSLPTGGRYFLTKDDLQYVNLDNYVVEGLYVVGLSGFIISLQDASTNTMCYEAANSFFYLPDGDQGMAISSRFSDINNALTQFGGKALKSSYDYYWTTERGSSTSEQNCINGRGGTLISLPKTNYCYVREVIPLSFESPWVPTLPNTGLFLAASDGNSRVLLSSVNDIPTGFSAEGLAVSAKGIQIIMALSDASSDRMNYSSASALYGTRLPDATQAKLISARFSDINNALTQFGGSVLKSSYEYYWTTKQGASSSEQYCINGSGGILISLPKTSTNYVRLVLDATW